MRRSALVYGLLLPLCVVLPLKAADTPVIHTKVSRLPPLAEPLDPLFQKMADARAAKGGDLLNLQLTTGHAPKISAATGVLAYALRFDAVTPRALRELTIMRTAGIVGSKYELFQHRPFLLSCGYSAAKIDAIPHWRASKLFDDKERAMLAYVDQVAHGGNVDDATYAKFASYFNPQEIVELTVLIGSYYSNGLLTKALRIQLETDGRHTAAGTC